MCAPRLLAASIFATTAGKAAKATDPGAKVTEPHFILTAPIAQASAHR